MLKRDGWVGGWVVAPVIFVSAQVLLVLTLGLWTSDLGLTISVLYKKLLIQYVPEKSMSFSTISLTFTRRKHLEVQFGRYLSLTHSTLLPSSASSAVWLLFLSAMQ